MPGDTIIKTDDGLIELGCFSDWVEENLEMLGFKKEKYQPEHDPFEGRDI
jgi:hypothetical protein